jgi:hypothetical protein
MIAGINRAFQHQDKSYQLQCEDLGCTEACFEIRICDGGSILWQKRFSYRDLLTQDTPDRARNVAIRAQMEKKVQTVEAAIAKGKLP